jgi:hypothetical protein
MRVQFAKIIRTARDQTGKHYPTVEEITRELHNDDAASLICRAASDVLNEPTEGMIADDNYAHYAVEELIGIACVEIFNGQVIIHEALNH